jgi:seryl-tRNA synthetase
MSREIDSIIKDINKNHKELCQTDNKLSKELFSIKKDLENLKKETVVIHKKIDTILEILSNLHVMILDEEDLDDEENSEWSPYSDNDYEADNYYLDDEDTDSSTEEDI